MKSEKFRLPAHWAVALVNDDETPFDYGDAEDHAAYKQFTQEHLHLGYFTVAGDGDGDSFLAVVHDAEEYGVPPCNVVDLLFIPYF